MKEIRQFNYNIDKNSQLIAERGIGFEEIIDEIANGNLITIEKHPNSKKYPNQAIMYIRCLEYVYAVPYITEKDGTKFLKTLYPSRKATKKYLEGI